MQGDMAVGPATLFKLATFIEAIDRRHHRFALVVQQQCAVHQHHRALAAQAWRQRWAVPTSLRPFRLTL
jgi:hypothetical protein